MAKTTTNIWLIILYIFSVLCIYDASEAFILINDYCEEYLKANGLASVLFYQSQEQRRKRIAGILLSQWS